MLPSAHGLVPPLVGNRRHDRVTSPDLLFDRAKHAVQCHHTPWPALCELGVTAMLVRPPGAPSMVDVKQLQQRHHLRVTAHGRLLAAAIDACKDELEAWRAHGAKGSVKGLPQGCRHAATKHNVVKRGRTAALLTQQCDKQLGGKTQPVGVTLPDETGHLWHRHLLQDAPHCHTRCCMTWCGLHKSRIMARVKWSTPHLTQTAGVAQARAARPQHDFGAPGGGASCWVPSGSVAVLQAQSTQWCSWCLLLVGPPSVWCARCKQCLSAWSAWCASSVWVVLGAVWCRHWAMWCAASARLLWMRLVTFGPPFQSKMVHCVCHTTLVAA